MTKEELNQEIKWCEEEISQDETVMETRDASNFHAQRLQENKIRLQEMLDAKGKKK